MVEFGSLFFKHSLNIMNDDIHADVNDFFLIRRIIREINVTNITLVPKVSVPATLGDFTPIACCFVLYKSISKFLCSQLNSVLPDIISRNQGAFVAGRSILHSVLVCQDPMKMYRKSQ
ncbi:uncharacterized protein [Spinacia oleracea]|uniref:Reverse transcriptase domain-containing protein n=1 Tax=Spinacia oleracea TaxID=3562 RepID=A0ABM3RRA2_SPIOL|nr:uncharacterized protein LOC130471836 [Spinacia oleracea]